MAKFNIVKEYDWTAIPRGASLRSDAPKVLIRSYKVKSNLLLNRLKSYIEVGKAVGGAGGGSSGTGTGGIGGGGSSATGNNTSGTNGTANTGGGAGGGNSATQPSGSFQRSGGSGIVIIRYPGATAATGGTITSSGGYTYHTFTTTGTFTPT